MFAQQSSPKLTEITTLASDPSTTRGQLLDDLALLHALQYVSESVVSFFAHTGTITRLLEWSLNNSLFHEPNTDKYARAATAVLCCNSRDLTCEVLDSDLLPPALMKFWQTSAVQSLVCCTNLQWIVTKCVHAPPGTLLETVPGFVSNLIEHIDVRAFNGCFYNFLLCGADV
jgi:hypothetical protein